MNKAIYFVTILFFNYPEFDTCFYFRMKLYFNGIYSECINRFFQQYFFLINLGLNSLGGKEMNKDYSRGLIRNQAWRAKRQKIIQRSGDQSINEVQAPCHVARYSPCKQAIKV